MHVLALRPMKTPILPVLVLLAAATLASAGGSHARADRSDRGLVPLDEERYRRVDELWTSLDGIHRHRIPTLVAAHSRVPGPRMIVAVYEQTEAGEVVRGSVEADTIAVDRVARLGPDRRQYLILRVGVDDGSPGAVWLSIHTIERGRLVRIAPPGAVHELRDVDSDGRLEALAFSTRLTGLAGLSPRSSPRVVQVWELDRGRYVEADRRYLRYHWRRLAELRRTLERAVEGAPGEDRVGLAIELFFEHEVLGQPEDGLTIASHYLRWVLSDGDRRTKRCAERALAALRARVEHREPRAAASRSTEG